MINFGLSKQAGFGVLRVLIWPQGMPRAPNQGFQQRGFTWSFGRRFSSCQDPYFRCADGIAVVQWPQ